MQSAQRTAAQPTHPFAARAWFTCAMSQPRVRRLTRIGLWLAVVDTVLLALVYWAMHGGSIANAMVVVTAPLAWLLAAVTAGFAGVVVFGSWSVRLGSRVAGSTIAGLAAVGFTVWPLGRAVDSGAVSAVACLDVDMEQIPCPAPPDWTWLWVLAGLVFYLGAALVFGIATRRQERRARTPLLRLLLLLLALIPFANIVGFIGFQRLEARESTPPLVVVGQSA